MAAAVLALPQSGSPRPVREVSWLLGVAAVAGLAGYLVVDDLLLAAALALVPVVLGLLTHPGLTGIALAVTVPFSQDVTGGRVGLNVSLSDLLLVVLLVAVCSEAVLLRDSRPLRALRPLGLPLLAYVGVMLLLLAYHGGLITAIKTGQRLELFLLPLVVGAALALRGHTAAVLTAYVLSSTFLAATWPFLWDTGTYAIQKNPAGQFMANAILLLVGVRDLRRLLPYCMPVLVPGLLFTLSRGAIVSVGVGLAVLLVLQRGRDRRRLALLLIPVLVGTALAFRLLPEEAQERTTNFRSGEQTAGAYALKIRDQYREDARAIIAEHRWTGIGVGRYLTGSDVDGTTSTDPHQVLLLQQAEGGYPLVAGFLVLVVGSSIVVARRRDDSPVAATAVAVSVAIAVHGLVDVYWVRGTPVVGWLLLGLALGQAMDSRRA